MRYSTFLAVVLCAFSGCGGGSSSPQFAKLRVLFGGSSVPDDLTVSIGGTTVVPTSSTCPLPNEPCAMDYLTVQASGVIFAIQAAGSSTNLVPSQFQTLNLSPNTQNTFVFVEPEFGYLFLDDSTPAAGSVKLRIANTDPTVGGTLSAWVNSTGSSTGNPTISGVTLGSASDYVTLPPGSYFVRFNLGCVLPFGPDCIVIGPTTFAANQNLTVYMFTDLDTHEPFILADN